MTAARQAHATRTTDGFAHEAALGAGERGFLELGEPFVCGAVEAAAPVLVVASPARWELLSRRIGAAAAAVRHVDVTDAGRNPARLIPLLRQFADTRPGDSADSADPVAPFAPADARANVPAPHVLVDALWPGCGADHVAEVLVHEALLGLAFADAPALRVRCSYDLDALAPPLVDAVRDRHPAIVGPLAGGPGPLGGAEPAAALTGPLPELHPSADTVTFTKFTEIRGLRTLVGERAARAGVGADRAADLVLAVHEIAVNSLRHGGDMGTLRVWADVGRVVCEVSDAGRVADPLVGRVRPAPSQLSGRGVWLANQLCDLVQLRSTESGTVVRLHMAA